MDSIPSTDYTWSLEVSELQCNSPLYRSRCLRVGLYCLYCLTDSVQKYALVYLYRKKKTSRNHFFKTGEKVGSLSLITKNSTVNFTLNEPTSQISSFLTGSKEHVPTEIKENIKESYMIGINVLVCFGQGILIGGM